MKSDEELKTGIYFSNSEIDEKKTGTIETPANSGIDVTNETGVISLNHTHKQEAEVVQCGCYKMKKVENEKN